ncbi:MAG: hypothetical protein H6707_14895 [Deltaproteobacteria bacterium]|nr:hypothetical protein [Deltaproteobacteria bacterium]
MIKPAPFSLLIALSWTLGCGGEASVRIGNPQLSDAGTSKDFRVLIIGADGGLSADSRVAVADSGGTVDSAPPSKADSGTPPPPKPDAALPKPDSGTTNNSGPTGPFGSTVGMTANNFTGIQDCDDKPYNLYDYYHQGKGVFVLLNSFS